VLDEEITGPKDDQELLKYLKLSPSFRMKTQAITEGDRFYE
jgi:hypothetical protein